MMKKRSRIWLALVCAACLTGCSAADGTEARLAPIENTQTLEVYFFDCGKADSMLLRQGDHAMLIDAATNKEGAHVVARLQEVGVRQLEAMLITHEDKDHVGGADRVLSALDVAHVYVGEMNGNSKQLEQFNEALSDKNIQAIKLTAGDHFVLGSAMVTVIGPIGGGVRQENDRSVVVRVDFGKTGFLFAGDAEQLSLTEMLAAPGARQNLSAQVLKVPHHGRIEGASAAFFEAVKPQIAVIPCRRGTEDNLPQSAVVSALEQAGAKVYVTGDGEVKLVSDGERITVTTSQPRQ